MSDYQYGTKITVPEVRGLDEVGAINNLRLAGLRIGKVLSVQAPLSESWLGKVIYTKPAAGSRVSMGANVSIMICGKIGEARTSNVNKAIVFILAMIIMFVGAVVMLLVVLN